MFLQLCRKQDLESEGVTECRSLVSEGVCMAQLLNFFKLVTPEMTSTLDPKNSSSLAKEHLGVPVSVAMKGMLTCMQKISKHYFKVTSSPS